MIDKHVIDEMWEFLYTVVSSNHSKYTSQRITDLNPLGSTEFGNDSDGLKPIAKKVTKTKQKSQQHIQDYTGIVHNLCKPVYVCFSREAGRRSLASDLRLERLWY